MWTGLWPNQELAVDVAPSSTVNEMPLVQDVRPRGSRVDANWRSSAERFFRPQFTALITVIEVHTPQRFQQWGAA